MAESAYRSKEAFAVFVDGMPRVVNVGDIVAADDPLVAKKAPTRVHFIPLSEWVEQATAAPGERRAVRLPSGQNVEEATRARDRRVGPRNTTTEDDMAHHLPPEHEDSPASPFAPGQPAQGVVADDVPPEQNPAGGPKASDAPHIEPDSPAATSAAVDQSDDGGLPATVGEAAEGDDDDADMEVDGDHAKARGGRRGRSADKK